MNKIAIILALLIGVSCSNGNNNKFPELRFSVDNNLVSEAITVNKDLSIKIPKNYTLLDSMSLIEIKRRVRKDELSYISLDILNVYKSNDNSSCVISLVNNSKLFSMLNEKYYESLQENFETDNIVRAQFSVNGINIIQYIIINNQFVTIKIFLTINDNFYQIDYFIPKNQYETELKKIESSIGSISLSKKRR